ncbi:receptor-type tyrosine-protein phosphatase C isoform X7 [Danio rerio]|uniref:Receptor-type tyrosine-protein phosphatase C isoform X7 n=1 Tax=Danio rerio TaxID=7955 RepID=A0AC58II59_DANRE
MARFFAIGPLVLVLCLVLYPSPTRTDENNSKETTTTTKDPSSTRTVENNSTATTTNKATVIEKASSPSHTLISSETTKTTGFSTSPTQTSIITTSKPSGSTTSVNSADTHTTTPTTGETTNAASVKESNATPTTPKTSAESSSYKDQEASSGTTLPSSADLKTPSPNLSTLTNPSSLPLTKTPTGNISPHTQEKNTSISPPLTSHQQNTIITSVNDTSLPPNITLMQPTSPIPPVKTTSMGAKISEETCQYNITWNETEAIINVSSIPNNARDYKNQTYIIKLKHNTETISNGISPLKIPLKMLKPCTEYTIHVDNCTVKGKNSFYSNDSESKEYTAIDVGDKQVCFEDKKWNLTGCANITAEDSCVQRSIEINLDKCIYAMKVLMPPVKPELKYNKTIPTKFEWSNKPLNKTRMSDCNDTFEIDCGGGKCWRLNQDAYLAPGKSYSCTGKYKYYNTFVNSTSTDILISCNWSYTNLYEAVTNNSIVISRILNPGDNCPGIIWHSFSATCQSESGKASSPVHGCDKINATTVNCTFNELSAYTEYKCSISAHINSTIGGEPFVTRFIQRTKSYKPMFGDKKDVNVSGRSHNSFLVNCKNLTETQWNGPRGLYQFELTSSGNTNKYNNSINCSFLFENLYYLTNYTIKITAINGHGKYSIVSTSTSTRYNDTAVIGFLAFLIVVTSIALLFVLYKIFLLKRKRTPEEDEICLTQPLRRVEPIYPEGLIDAYRTKIADESRLFMDEFQSIPRIFNNYTIKEAKRPENQSKNRYVDILPYDYNRVTLSSGAYGDYINASFIEGYQEPKKYIAAQGPKDETIVDFWQMMWEQKSSIIVMVTRCEEGNKVKCAQYWPCLDRETEIFDDFVVKIKTEEHCPDYIIRHLVLANKREKASEREITHIQFISWPDHGVPTDPGQLLKLRRRVNSFKNFFSGPIVVHCSAGVGRTGTYIGIDAMIESLEAENRVDIYGFVAKLRRQRCLMVQVEAQYILIHTALIEHNQFGETEILLSEFHSVLNTIREKQGNESIMEIEFQKLPKFKNWRTINTGSSEENKDKNRDSKVIPYDYNRVLFRLDIAGNQTSDPEDDTYSSDEEEEESNEYINASFLDGYWCQKSLIAAQGPLPNTTAEFLLMLYQQQTKTVVMLTDCQEDGKDLCCQYWGDEKKVFGDMEIEVKKTESFPTYVKRHLEIQSTKKNEILELDQYQFLKWKSNELPENAQELIEMIKNIRENGKYDNSKKNRSIPIVVHCSNGSSRTGLFCALWNLMDCSLTEKLVDVFQVVKNLRKERQGMVETFEQYQFLYTTLEGAFPVQNGTIKTPAATDSAEIINETPVQINETTALLAEPAAEAATEHANSTPATEQKETEDGKTTTESSELEAKENSSAAASPAEGDGEKNTPEATTNGPAATVEA